MEQVVLVNEKDEQVGVMEKLEAHKKGLLHRAFSIFIFNKKGEMMIQKRATHKYHSGGLWTNTCCSHPRPSENLKDAIHRRLVEEMGFDCNMVNGTHILYKKKLRNGLIEHEYDYIYLGKFENDPMPNIKEVEDWKWINLSDLKQEIAYFPENFTEWFRLIMTKKEFLNRFLSINV